MVKAKVIHTVKKETREGKIYYRNALLINGRFGDELAVASSEKDYSANIENQENVDVFWYKDHYCIKE